MRLLVTAAVIAASLWSTAFADAPSTSLRPLLRTMGAPETSLAAQAATFSAAVITLRPRARPGLPEVQLDQAVAAVAVQAGQPAPAAAQDAILSTMSMAAPLSAPRPAPRPRLAEQPRDQAVEQVQQVAAVRILPGKSAVIGRKGSVCGDPAIKGEVLAPITSRVRGCGIEDPVRVTSVSGVALKQSAVIDCATARALNDWVSGALKPAFGRKDVAALRIAGSYSCRTRNNVKGAPISEHGRGKAIDIAGVELANGTTLTVLGDWRRGSGKPIKKAYKAACGTFGTTLGPDSDRFHRDHMHFDTARQRGGAYCR